MARTGVGELKKALKTASSPGSFGGKLGYCNWKEGETKYLRFLTDLDDALTVQIYEWIVDHKGGTQNFIKAPDLHDGEEDWVLKYGGKMRERGNSGDLVEPKPKERTIGIAILQEEDPQEVNGKTVIGYRDVIEEIEYQGEKYPARQFLIVKQALRNFWQPLVGFYEEYETICDRVYKITRVGGNKDTTYNVVPKNPDPDFDLKEHYASYGYGVQQDENNPDRFLFCPQTVLEWADRFASEERVKYFLLGDGGEQQQQQASSQPAANGLVTDEADEAQASPAPSESDMSSLRARLQRHRP